MMAQTFSSSEKQGVITVSIEHQSAGTKTILKDKGCNIIIGNEPQLSFTIVILSSPNVKNGESYTVFIGSVT